MEHKYTPYKKHPRTTAHYQNPLDNLLNVCEQLHALLNANRYKIILNYTKQAML